jgi:uncharacterized membrane protein
MLKITSIQKLSAIFIAFIIALLACRALYVGYISYIFLLWNLFLAWVPFRLSLLFKKIKRKQPWKQILVFALWLLFFPNALYIVTDLIHLDNASTVPVWFDAILIFTSSVTGLLFAFASLHKAEVFLKQRMNMALVKNFAPISLFAGSFGVYIGRFLRWNSWDVVTNPFILLHQIGACFYSPVQHYKSWVVTLLLTCLFSLLYFSIKKLPSLLKEPGN